MFCPLCGKELNIKGQPKETSWGVCPDCGYCDFIVAANLRNYNLTLRQAIKLLERGETLPVDVSLKTLKSIEAHDFLYKRMGILGKWTEKQWKLVGKQHDINNIQQVRSPQLLCLDSGFIDYMHPYMLSASAKLQEPDMVAGINVPIFQEELQCVGYCALFKPSKDNFSCFSWRTYLHRFFEKTPRSYLCYRPCIAQSNKEILLVDNFTEYLQATWFYDTGYREPNKVFPNAVAPILMIGQKETALDYLLDYTWESPRITLVTPSNDVVKMVRNKLMDSHKLRCPKLRYAENAEALAGYIRKCKSRDGFEHIIDNYFVETTKGVTNNSF